MTLSVPNWKVGDLGRFEIEGNKHPRFEVLGENPSGIIVWYAGDLRPQVIPQKTFQEECVNHWLIDIVPVIPSWMKRGVVFNLADSASRITQAEVSVQPTLRRYTERKLLIMDLQGKDLKLRHIRLDHVSCLVESERQLALIPIKTVALFGSAVKSSWDVILGDEMEEPDEIEDLLRGL